MPPTIEHGVLRFEKWSLDRHEWLDQVYCIGFRFTDDPGEAFTRIADAVKGGREEQVERACRKLRTLGRCLGPTLRQPLWVAPIIGSRHRSSQPSHVPHRLAVALGEGLGGRVTDSLLTKEPHEPLHSLKHAVDRDQAVLNTYTANPPEDDRPQTVVLVDDLLTRGSSMNDAARAIKAAFPDVTVIGVAFAKTERRLYWSGRPWQPSNEHLKV